MNSKKEDSSPEGWCNSLCVILIPCATLLGLIYLFLLYARYHQRKFLEQHLESANARLIKALDNIEQEVNEN